jgi:hypothetical protein
LLSGEGFFNTQRPGDVGVKLTVRINGKELSKNWDQIAELNVLAQRVRREGQLLAFTRPSALAIERGQIHSTRAYDEMVAKGGGSNGLPVASPMASAFSVTPQPANSALMARLPAVAP